MIAPKPSSTASEVGETKRALHERPARLVICTAMTATPGRRDGTFVLTRKFLEGVQEYCKHWPGSVCVWIQQERHADSNLDHVEVHPNELPFDLKWLQGDEHDPRRFVDVISEADVLLAALIDRHVGLASQCARAGAALVYVTEYSVLTRQQIVRTETRNPILRWRRTRWTTQLEREYQAAVRQAAGAQCNGLPTYNAYASINPRCLLYFDTRVRERQLITPESLHQRLQRLRNGQPIRLAFSGRLIAMKGADHLLLVARELAARGVAFSMDICGGGELESGMRRDIAALGLHDRVRMRGVLDFERELLPFIAHEVDLFVCCHRQGDPSCTYLETYSCGVPIVGYDNEAFAGLAVTSGAGGRGFVTAMDDPVTLAAQIADLNNARELIERASHNALDFASRHTFEHTMRQRVQHMFECMHADRPVHSVMKPA